MADKLSAIPAIPCTTARQIHRNNVPATTPKDCYQQALVILSLNTLIKELGFRFNKLSVRASLLSLSCSFSFM